MKQDVFIESIDLTISKLKGKINLYNNIIGISNFIKIVLSASIPILIHEASEYKPLLLIVSIASAIITVIQSSLSAFNLQNKVQTATEILGKIENEKLLYITQTSPYNKTDEENFHLFVATLQTELNDIIADFNQVNN
ncbi:DUF4231 domain-containing protein [Enterococcus faecalis]|uniref:DUF4231 domain-containing protein n=1 Tax=Enterococcus faecalis TaxID=1351 RepID=UPI00032E9E9A|nr:DUF4231 domain-containing protein [Enterococcus faecalis]EHA3993835.1 DUF4231 domain-containing protein [Enterococcus faecalis]EHQ8828651.1 DUF4231 domain-containing protein [Enterococcus faecalis]EOJ96014.1 hypothetical protein WOQ_02696 [Enterococcus faecalis EnGen0340]MBM9831848.1 DUF4231 domain-containing protein [Enterococcus faecalis]MCO5440300.1 DUF4231 domain-containing protein [Enterococcus faecalis]